MGIHLFELLTWLVFAWVLQRQARAWFDRRWMAATLPIPMVGTYFVAMTYNDQTQVEALINMPLLAAVMLSMPDDDGDLSKRRAFAAGFFMAVVAYLKLPYVAIPLAVAAVTLVRLGWADVRRTVVDVVWPALLGAAVLVVPFVVYFAIADAYSEIYELYFEYSRERNDLWPRPSERLETTSKRTLRIFSPFIALGGLGVLVNWRGLLHRRALAMVVWAAVAVPLFLVQQWWTYHAFLWLVPFTLFGWFALAAVLDSGRSLRSPVLIVGATAVVLLALTQLGPDGLRKAERLATNDFGLTQDGRDALRRDVDRSYADAQAWSAWNQSIGDESSAWGIGVNPNFLFVAGQDHELSTLTWPTQLISVEIYDRIAGELSEDPPARFIVHADAFADMELRSPSTLAVIESDFCVAEVEGFYSYLLRANDAACP